MFGVIILVVVIVTVLSVGLSLKMALPALKNAKQLVGNLPGNNPEAARLMQTGIPTSATISQIQMGQGTVILQGHRHLQVHIQLQVQPQGAAPYPAQVTTMISELQIPQFQPNVVIQVRVDPTNPHNIALG